MKTTLGVILGVVLGIIIVVGVTSFLLDSGCFSFDRKSVPEYSQNTPRITSTVSAAAQTSNPVTTNPPKSAAVTTTPAATTGSPSPAGTVVVSTPTITTAPEVKFTINIPDFKISGNSGEITTEVTNTGNIDAHNCWAKVEIYCQGSLIRIDGQDYYRRDLGLLRPGVTLTSQDTLKVSLGDALKIMQYGATCKLTITSDEATMGYQYQF